VRNWRTASAVLPTGRLVWMSVKSNEVIAKHLKTVIIQAIGHETVMIGVDREECVPTSGKLF
jgi:hypothetical protein